MAYVTAASQPAFNRRRFLIGGAAAAAAGLVKEAGDYLNVSRQHFQLSGFSGCAGYAAAGMRHKIGLAKSKQLAIECPAALRSCSFQVTSCPLASPLQHTW